MAFMAVPRSTNRSRDDEKRGGGEKDEQKKQLQRVVETLTLLDDPDFTSESKAVEIAVRMRGCGRQCTFGVSHVYWA